MAMRPAELSMTQIFTSVEPKAVQLSIAMLRGYVIGLALANYEYLKANPHTPSLSSSGVRYVPERGTENWLPIPDVLRQGYGDCEDLAAWRVAEYWIRGVRNAKPDVRARLIGGVWRAHAFVRLPDGRIDDPSLQLGMKGID